MSRAKDLYDALVAKGEAEIDRMIAEEVVEDLFIDYKRSANDAREAKLAQDDRDNYAKAICGFGNSEGGVVLWGIECKDLKDSRGDVPGKKFPLKSPNRFRAFLENATSGLTLPPHDRVSHHVIGSAADPDEGYVVSHIPKSMYAPLQCLGNRYANRFLVRIGSRFESAPYGLLVGMFGRQPTPVLSGSWTYSGKLAHYESNVDPAPSFENQYSIRNDGLGMAKDIYLNFRFERPGTKCRVTGGRGDIRWEEHASIPYAWHLVSSPGFRLAPAATVTAFNLTVFLVPPFTRNLEFDITFGCEGGPITKAGGVVPRDRIEALVEEFMARPRDDRRDVFLGCEALGFERPQVIIEG